MKLFTSEDIRTIERETISADGITARTLVERVAEAAASEIATRWRPTKRTVIFAGPGNNGADALATACMVLGAEKALEMIGTAEDASCYLLVAQADTIAVITSPNWGEMAQK